MLRLVRCPGCRALRDPRDGRCGGCGRSLLLATRTPRAMSADEYVEAFDTESLLLTRTIIWVGGWVPVGMVAIVVAFISGEWLAFLLIALAGTILGYLAAIGALLIFDFLDIRWLRTGRPEDAGFVTVR